MKRWHGRSVFVILCTSGKLNEIAECIYTAETVVIIIDYILSSASCLSIAFRLRRRDTYNKRVCVH